MQSGVILLKKKKKEKLYPHRKINIHTWVAYLLFLLLQI